MRETKNTMGGSCHHRCVKGFLYLINVVFFATGLMLLIVSSLSITQTNLFKEFLPYLPSLIVVYQGSVSVKPVTRMIIYNNTD